jgi:hypothetical protein
MPVKKGHRGVEDELHKDVSDKGHRVTDDR